MKPGCLKMRACPKLDDGRMVVAMTGWMDGGKVSTGTAEWLIRHLGARKAGRIEPAGFYILSFPGSMETSAMLRPHAEIVDGSIRRIVLPQNSFYCDESARLAVFIGSEPNVHWEAFAEALFAFASRAGVRTVYFVGSFAGVTPHTREPRIISAVSNDRMKTVLEPYGVRPANYEGPASFSTWLMTLAPRKGIDMASLVAEIPPYIEGTNPKCIEAVLRKLVGILGLPADLAPLRRAVDRWEHRVNRAVQAREELASLIGKLEERYDSEVFDTQMGDLKDWLTQQGIRLD